MHLFLAGFWFWSLGFSIDKIMSSANRDSFLFLCISQVLVCCVSIFVCLRIFLNFAFYFFFDPLIVQSVLFNFHPFVNFPVFLLPLISSSIPLWLEKILGIYISIFLKSCDLTCDLYLRMCHMCLRRMYILLLLG